VVAAEGVAHIKATFNNTLITIADQAGNVLVWASAGTAEILTRSPLRADAAEVTANRRARSAKLRAARVTPPPLMDDPTEDRHGRP